MARVSLTFKRDLWFNFPTLFAKILMRFLHTIFVVAFTLLVAFPLLAKAEGTARGDKMMADYFRHETAEITFPQLTRWNYSSPEKWKAETAKRRKQLREMLGIEPLPERTDLKATVTRRLSAHGVNVENVHFQSSPGLYVTGNLYLPEKVEGKLPAVLYVCGHGRVTIDGVSYGNKVHYQHHGAWFARHGYACLMIDTIQLGEIEGVHHGTYRHNMWWWLNRGYTPAGVEAWNCIRALDYLQSRKEVDGDRIAVTGRSGGGAYSWWIAAIDERIKAAVPVAGITDLHNHVVDGCVEGHCDCMYMVNTYRWDYPAVAALVAPRPLLLSNSDRDRIFPLDGVVRTFSQLRAVWNNVGEPGDLGLNITSGPHSDTQQLRTSAFHWINHHLKDDDNLIETPARPVFQPQQLKVFDKIPEDEIVTKIHETFVPAAEPKQPKSKAQWEESRNDWMKHLEQKTFRGWPDKAPPANAKEAFSTTKDGIHFRAVDFTSEHDIGLRLYIASPAGKKKNDLMVLNVLNDKSWSEFTATMQVGFNEQLKEETLGEPDAKAYEDLKKMFESFNWTMAWVAPRGVGPTAFDSNPKKQIQIRRRFYLLGQTLQGMQVWDAIRAASVLRETLPDTPLWLQSQQQMAGVTAYASLYVDDVTRIDLHDLPASHRDGPFLLNVRKSHDLPHAIAMAADRSQVVLYNAKPESWKFVTELSKTLKWNEKQFRIRE